MRKTILRTLAYASLSFIVLQSCKDDSNLLQPLPIPDQSFVEEFDTLQAAKNKGWLIRNRSEPIGSGVWVQGLAANALSAYTAYSSKSTSNGFISVDYTSSHNLVDLPIASRKLGTISNFVISPKVILQNGDKIIFYSRQSDTAAAFADRLQVVVSTKGASIECGRGEDPGDFKMTILDINAEMASGRATNPFVSTADFTYPAGIYVFNRVKAFPSSWTRFEAVISGLDGPTEGRFAIRYYVPLGGAYFDNANGDEYRGRGSVCLSIDSVAFVSKSRR
jgi:hypothetical protein